MTASSFAERALARIEQLEARLVELERNPSEPIAVIGMACRLPGADSPEQYWQLLMSGRDVIRDIPRSRWDNDAHYDPDPKVPGKIGTRWAGLIDGVDQFDRELFDISPREAIRMDPQQRVLLEVAWRAFEDAGLPLSRLRGAAVGSYIGICGSDYGRMQHQHVDTIDAYTSTGSALSIAAARLAYQWDLRGPTMAVDTACSSSLCALHLAVTALRRNECDMALAGGVHLMLTPDSIVSFTKWGMLSPDGRCKTFDARANGIVMGEGCGVLVLKRLAAAQRDGDRILALVHGTALNQDGRSLGVTAPNVQAQREVIRAALGDADLRPSQIGYIEAHGTGTSLGDPIEMEAIGDVYGRSDRPALWVGSSKTNIGHLEAAAGIAGLIKLIDVLRHGQIPPNLHFETLNPRIDLGDSIRVPQRIEPFTGPARYAAISSFGFGGTNAHVIVGPAPAEPDVELPADDAATILPLSACRAESLPAIAAATLGQLGAGAPLGDVCWSAATRASHHRYRLALVGASEAIKAQLQAVASGGLGKAPVDSGQQTPRVAFVFSGHGAQWLGMAEALLANDSLFAAHLGSIAEVLERRVSWRLRDALHSADMLERVEVIQPALFAVQVAIAQWLIHCGVQPVAVIGHSMGEVAAAHVAGALSLDDAVAVIVARSQLLADIRGQGGMLMLAASSEQTLNLLRAHPELSIGANNGPASLVVAGPTEALERLASELSAGSVRFWRVKTDVPFHSPLVDPLAPRLQAALSITPQSAAISFISTVTGEQTAGTSLDASYWARNLRDPVRFWPGLQRLLEDGVDVLVEVAAHPVLSTAMLQGIDLRGDSVTVVDTLRKDGSGELLRSAALTLWAHGLPLQWAALLPRGRTLPAVPQPFYHERYWLKPDVAAPSEVAEAAGHPLLGSRTNLAIRPEVQLWQRRLRPDAPRWLSQHRLGQDVVLPAAAVIEMMLSAAKQTSGRAAVASVRLEQLAAVHEQGTEVQLSLQPDGELSLFFRDVANSADAKGWRLQARARLAQQGADIPAAPDLAAIANQCAQSVDMKSRYADLRAQGITLGEAFQAIDEGHIGSGQAIGLLRNGAEWRDGRYAAHPCLIDAAMQTLALALPGGGADAAGMHVPTGADHIELFSWPPEPPFRSWARVRSCDARGAKGDVSILDANGRVALHIAGLSTERIERDDSYHLVRWLAQPLPTAMPELEQLWLVIESDHATSTPCAVDAITIERALSQAGANSQVVTRAELSTLLAREGQPCTVVYVASAHTADTAVNECLTLKSLAAELVERAQATRLLVVTTAAQDPNGSVDNPYQACHWGFMRSLAHEHPELRSGLLDCHGDEPQLGPALCRLPAHAQWLLRDGMLFSPRLDQLTLLTPQAPRLHRDRSYLVTGAMGGLGQAVSLWLARQGVGELVLLSRQGERHPDAHALRTALADLGQKVQIVAADVNQLDDVARAVNVSSLPLAGVFHLAGMLADAPIRTMSNDQLRQALSPKLHGTMNLWQATRGADCAVFVCFSSIAGVLGSPGQANYAAGNAFVDAWAEQCRAAGQAVLSIAWGGWAEAGMAQRSGVIERLAARGLGSFRHDQGLSALGRLLAEPPRAQVAYAPLDKGRVAVVLPASAESGLLAVAALTGGNSIREQLKAAPASARRRLLLRHLAELLSGVVALDPEQIHESTELARFSFDSMTALELRNALSGSIAVKIPVTLVWTQRTVGDVRDFLLSELGYADEPQAQTSTVDSNENRDDADLASVLAELDQLSDEAVRNELLDAE